MDDLVIAVAVAALRVSPGPFGPNKYGPRMLACGLAGEFGLPGGGTAASESNRRKIMRSQTFGGSRRACALALPRDEFKLFSRDAKRNGFCRNVGVRGNLGLRKSFRISRHINHLNPWMEFRHLPRQFGAANPRHHHVRHQHVDVAVMPPGHFQQRPAGSGSPARDAPQSSGIRPVANAVPFRRQQGQSLKLALFPGRRLGCNRGARPLCRGSFAHRKVQLETGAHTTLRFHIDCNPQTGGRYRTPWKGPARCPCPPVWS